MIPAAQGMKKVPWTCLFKKSGEYVASTSSVSNDYSYTKTQRTPKKELDKNDFLSLLATQLQNQDPLDPQSNDEFIATMAQFNSLEAMSSIDSTTQYDKAMNMVGKMVNIEQSNGDTVTGTVEKMSTEDGKVYVYVGGVQYSLSDVQEVQPNGDNSQITASSWDLMQAALLIGKEVTVDGDSSGTVDKVSMSDGQVKVYVNGQAYDIGSITEISSAGESSASQAQPEVDQNESEQQGTG